MEEKREPYWDYMGRKMYEGRPLTKEDMWKKEVADMQKQVHTLQIRVKELSEELNKIKSINAGGQRVHFDFYGLMFRETLDDNSPMFAFSHCLYSSFVAHRSLKGSMGIGNYEKGAGYNKMPIWLKITRSGNTFTAYYSLDNSTWTKQYSADVNLPSKVYIGMFATSSKNDQAFGAEFTDFQINGSVPKSENNTQSTKTTKPKKEVIEI